MNALAVRPVVADYQFPLNGQNVRSVILDGEPWFVGRDVADALGYANSRKAVKDHVPAGHRRGNGAFPLTDLGLQAQTVLIDEPGMYRLIMRANTTEAEEFQEWVTAVVLPAIRKTGGYGSAAGPLAALDSPEAILQLATAYHDAAKRLVGAQQRVAELEPAAEAWGALASAKGDLSLKDAAAVLNRDPAISTGQNRLLTFLRTEGLVDRKGRPYVRYSAYLVERVSTWNHEPTGEDRLYHAIRVTPAGLEYLRKRLGAIRAVA